jgi:hypothetical protein
MRGFCCRFALAMCGCVFADHFIKLVHSGTAGMNNLIMRHADTLHHHDNIINMWRYSVLGGVERKFF